MSSRQILASILLTLSAVSLGESRLAAQSSTSGNSLLVPVTGASDLGGMFSGAFIVQHFAQQGSSIVATGTVTGALVINGVVRNLVIQTALPLDLSASRARLNTDAALAKASCDVLHVEFGATTISVLSTTLGFNSVAFDLTATQPGAMTSLSSPGTVTPLVSGNTTQAGSSTPGTVPQTPTPTAPTQAQLRPLLCAVDGFKNVNDPALLVQQLNAILAALAAPTTGS
jgi:hypothetical protein